MPYRTLSLDEAADYLHLKRGDLEDLVKHQEIPHDLRGERPIFRQRDLDDWISQRILGFNSKRLNEYHQNTTRRTKDLVAQETLMPDLVQPACLQPALPAKTKASVVREIAAFANQTGQVMDPEGLVQGLTEREELCSTGLPGGLAILHTRHHEPFMFESSFLVVARTLQEIHFGAPDGRPTDLFFLVCCQEDRLHLHTLARICVMVMKTDLLTQLRMAEDAAQMHTVLLEAEVAALADRRPPE